MEKKRYSPEQIIRLKRLVTEQALDNRIVKEVAAGNL